MINIFKYYKDCTMIFENRKTKLYSCDHCHECPYKNLCAKDKDKREFREFINPAVDEAKFFHYSDFGQ